MERQSIPVMLETGSVKCPGRSNDVVLDLRLLENHITDNLMVRKNPAGHHRLMPWLPQMHGFGGEKSRQIAVV
jgi:hypothetical protein